MPVKRVGERCVDCATRPVWDYDSGLCAPCWHRHRMSGRAIVSRWDALHALGLAPEALSAAFEAELRDWLDGG
jgi:hypothetical protein